MCVCVCVCVCVCPPTPAHAGVGGIYIKNALVSKECLSGIQEAPAYVTRAKKLMWVLL